MNKHEARLSWSDCEKKKKFFIQYISNRYTESRGHVIFLREKYSKNKNYDKWQFE
jgi:hypothetical protein